MRWEWGDLRYFLAVAEAGTTLGAARSLGVNQTTCARRIAALEEALGVALFERSASGYALTTEGEALLPAARGFGECAAGFKRTVDELRNAGLQLLRVTTNDAMADPLVAPAIARFRAEHPDVRVELNITDALIDIAAGEADIAIRGAEQAASAGSVIQRRLPGSRWGFYCSPGYAAANGMPGGVGEAGAHSIATLGGAVQAVVQMMAPGAQVVDVTNSVGSLVAVLRAGYCIGPLPCLVGDAAAGLMRCFLLPDEAPTWLVYAERLKGRPEARAFIDFLIAHCEAMRPALRGEV